MCVFLPSPDQIPSQQLHIFVEMSYIRMKMKVNTTMVSTIGDVLNLFVHKEWDQFDTFILSRPTLFQNISIAVSLNSQLNGMTLLHAAVRFSPPLDVIYKMIELCPYMVAVQDCLGRTALHVATGSGASPKIVALIANAHPPACDVQDRDGKTPLHFACDCSCVLFEDDGYICINSSKQQLYSESIVALLSHSLRATTLKDFENMIPLQHAILSKASSETIRMISDHMICFSDHMDGDRPRKKVRMISLDEGGGICH